MGPLVSARNGGASAGGGVVDVDLAADSVNVRISDPRPVDVRKEGDPGDRDGVIGAGVEVEVVDLRRAARIVSVGRQVAVDVGIDLIAGPTGHHLEAARKHRRTRDLRCRNRRNTRKCC